MPTNQLNTVCNSIGISAKAAGYGTSTTAITLKQFMKPIGTVLGSQFLTQCLSARCMILAVTEGGVSHLLVHASHTIAGV